MYPDSLKDNRQSPCPKCRSNNRDKSGNNLIEFETNFHCFACGYHVLKSNQSGNVVNLNNHLPPTSERDEPMIEYEPSEMVPSRGVTPRTFEFYGVHSDNTKHIYPYYKNNDLTGIQTRYLAQKGFSTKGETIHTGLFGSHKFAPSCSKEVLITEGALDALSAYQLLNGTVPCLAFVNNTVAKGMAKANFDYINSFKTIYLCPDNDEPGELMVKEVAPMFSGKVKIIRLPQGFKDANDVLQVGDYTLFNKLKANAQLWVPDEIVCSDSTYNDLLNYKDRLKVTQDYPWKGLTDTLYGIRQGELVTICGGTGIGKSTFVKEILYHLLKNTDDLIGAIFLEETLEKTELSIIGIDLGKPIHLPNVDVDKDMFEQSYKELLSKGRVFHHKHFGSTQIDNIINRIRYMVKVLGCKYVFLDHISMIVSSQENGDERKALDEVATKVRMLIEETGATIFMVSHLKRTDKAHEEGQPVSLNHIRGSAGIAQVSDVVISLERNQQDDNVDRRSMTTVRVLKNRFSGETGKACTLFYNKDYYRFQEVEEVAEEEEGNSEFTGFNFCATPS